VAGLLNFGQKKVALRRFSTCYLLNERPLGFMFVQIDPSAQFLNVL